MTEIIFFDDVIDVLPYKNELWELLKLCDIDFFPSLSSRENNPDGPRIYFEGLFREDAKFQLAFDGEKLVGFSIFFHDYYEELIALYTPCNYVKIACVHPSYRGQRIASMFNEFIEELLPESLKMPFIVRRTWSTNLPQMRILEKNGYELIHINENDRGYGCSTVCYGKAMSIQLPLFAQSKKSGRMPERE